jgi:hypothetical protein
MIEIWKYMQILEMKSRLKENIDRITDDERVEYMKLDERLDELHMYLFGKRE